MAWQAESDQPERTCKAASLIQGEGVDLDAVPAYERRPDKTQALDRRNRPAGRGSTSGGLAMAQTERILRKRQSDTRLHCLRQNGCVHRLAVATALNKTVQARNRNSLY